MIFVDSNIPMYLVGAEHPNKDRAVAAVQGHVLAGEPLITDVEVFQEILHRYASIDRRAAIDPAFAALDGLTEHVEPVSFEDVGEARRLVLTMQGLSARDAVHVAVMRRLGCTKILSFDRGFDGVQGLTRLPA